jgi:hypothetical protein
MEEAAEYNSIQNPIKGEVKYLNHPEWCFQFFDNEPVPFAFSKDATKKDPLILEVQPVENEGLVFSYKGMTFRIFAREISEESKEQLNDETKG